MAGHRCQLRVPIRDHVRQHGQRDERHRVHRGLPITQNLGQRRHRANADVVSFVMSEAQAANFDDNSNTPRGILINLLTAKQSYKPSKLNFLDLP